MDGVALLNNQTHKEPYRVHQAIGSYVPEDVQAVDYDLALSL